MGCLGRDGVLTRVDPLAGTVTQGVASTPGACACGICVGVAAVKVCVCGVSSGGLPFVVLEDAPEGGNCLELVSRGGLR